MYETNQHINTNKSISGHEHCHEYLICLHSCVAHTSRRHSLSGCMLICSRFYFPWNFVCFLIQFWQIFALLSGRAVRLSMCACATLSKTQLLADCHYPLNDFMLVLFSFLYRYFCIFDISFIFLLDVENHIETYRRLRTINKQHGFE